MLNKIINLTVFFTGGAVLVLEVSATRTLSPHFGNTIFTVSSILSVVLGALAIGYLCGGRLADRAPRLSLFFGIIWLGGLTVLLMNITTKLFLDTWFSGLGNMFGPLLASLLLFFVPSLFLGMLSPFAIRLKSEHGQTQKIGSNSGEVFFFSTAGSIIGSLMTGFLFIPHVGVSRIILLTGLSLLIVGSAGLFFFKFNKRYLISIIVLSFILSGATLIFSERPLIAGEIYHAEGTYERIAVADNTPNFEGRRTLFLDKSASSVIFLSDGSPLATLYAKYLELGTLLEEEPENILVLGGGGYAIPRYAKQLFPRAEIDVVEIEPRLFELSKKYFYFNDTSKITNYVQAGRMFLANSQKKYDIIFIDVYSSFISIPSHMTTIEFFALVKENLSDKGMLLSNVIGSLDHSNNRFFTAKIKTFFSIFPNTRIFAISDPQSLEPQNFAFVATKKGENNYIEIAAKQSKSLFLSVVSSYEVERDKINLDKAILLTDDFSPIEYLVAPLVALY